MSDDALKNGHHRNGQGDSMGSTGYAAGMQYKPAAVPTPWLKPWLLNPVDTDALPLHGVGSPVVSSSCTTALHRFVGTALSNVANALVDMPHDTDHGRSILRVLEHATLHPEAVNSFFAALLPHINLKLTSVKGVPLVHGSRQWKTAVNVGFNNMHNVLLSPDVRDTVWRHSFGGNSLPPSATAASTGALAASCISGLLVHELIAYILPAVVAVHVDTSDLDETESVVGSGAASVSDEEPVADPVSLGFAHDKLETCVLRYITGWALQSVKAAGVVLSASERANFDQLMCALQHGYGAFLPQSVRLGPAQRLTRPCEALCAFVVSLEDYIREHVFNPRTLLQHGKDVYTHGMTLLSTSARVRQLWSACVQGCNNPTGVVFSDKVQVLVLEKFVRQYMLSRTKTFRDVAGLLPEGMLSSSTFCAPLL